MTLWDWLTGRDKKLPRDTAATLQQDQSLAANGDATAQFRLAWRYYTGDGVMADNSEAIKWFTLAANQGVAAAQCNLGALYLTGTVVSKDVHKAIALLRLAASQGAHVAQYHLGVCYMSGEGVSRDPAEAINWYRQAAVQGYAPAQNNLGVCYMNGEGVARDATEAKKWLGLAAAQGFRTARSNLTGDHAEELVELLMNAGAWGKEHDWPSVIMYPQYGEIRAIGALLDAMGSKQLMIDVHDRVERRLASRGADTKNLGAILSVMWDGIGSWIH